MRKNRIVSRSDRRILLVGLILAAIAVVLYSLTGGKERSTVVSESDSVSMHPRHEYRNPSRYHRRHSYYYVAPKAVETFPFDPNTADSTQLLRLGLSPWQVRNIYKYRAKGGVFRRAKDFGTIYGLTKAQYRRLEPYIRIGDAYRPAIELVGERKKYEPYERDTLRYPVKIAPTEHIVLNTADTSQLKRVPGIGSGWARRIVSYGERLGGYVSVDQLRELEGFPESSLTYFVVSHPQPRKLNINSLTLNQLRHHPYINFYQARAIIDFRRLKGTIQSIDQLRLLPDFTPEAIQRLRPYIVF